MEKQEILMNHIHIRQPINRIVASDRFIYISVCTKTLFYLIGLFVHQSYVVLIMFHTGLLLIKNIYLFDIKIVCVPRALKK